MFGMVRLAGTAFRAAGTITQNTRLVIRRQQDE
jgi:hypothetical protein